MSRDDLTNIIEDFREIALGYSIRFSVAIDDGDGGAITGMFHEDGTGTVDGEAVTEMMLGNIERDER